jgi:hypothetical protein
MKYLFIASHARLRRIGGHHPGDSWREPGKGSGTGTDFQHYQGRPRQESHGPRSNGGVFMTKIDERITASMDLVLEEVCRDLPHGGDHETRKYIAKKLIHGAKKGNTTPDGLRGVARMALEELSHRRSA